MLTTLFSLTCAIPAVWLGYTLRSYLIARTEWPQYSAETKSFYLLVAPPITLATDVFLITDRLFYSPADRGMKRRLVKLLLIASMVLLSMPALSAEFGTLAVKQPLRTYLSTSEISAIQYREPFAGQLEAGGRPAAVRRQNGSVTDPPR